MAFMNEFACYDLILSKNVPVNKQTGLFAGKRKEMRSKI